MIKRLEKADAEKLCAINGDFLDGWNNQMLERGFDGGRLNALGAFDGDNLVGYILYSLGVDDADIEIILTCPSHRRKGVASALYLTAEREIIESGKQKIFLEVRQSNEGAIALYERLGFNQVSCRKKYYNDGEDAFVFVKEIVK